MKKRVTATVAGLVALTAPLVQAQSLDRQRPEFEVASVKVNASGRKPFGGVRFLPGGRVSATNTALFLVIMAAYDISLKQLETSNLLDTAVDIEARADANALPQGAPEDRVRQLRLMLQTMLESRFNLAIHKNTKDFPMYALVVAKNGPRLKPAPPERECPAGATCGHVGGGPGIGLSGLGAEVSDLAAALSALIDREVIDRTGIQGRFDIELPRWSRSQLTVQATADTSDASIFTVLQEQLGLRLESTHGPLDVYTVDHVEWPSEN